MAARIVQINRAPVLTLWGAVVAERLGHEPDTALSFGKCLAGLNAQSKGRMLGIFGEPKAPEIGGKPRKVGLGEDLWVEVCGRALPAKNTENGVRAVVKDKPIEPEGVERYLNGKFKDDLPAVRAAMTALAGALSPEQLKGYAYDLYERFRPQIERGKRGWAQKGDLDLDLIESLADEFAGI